MKILLLPLCGLGDAVCWLPAFSMMRDKYQDARITAVVSSNSAANLIRMTNLEIETVVFNREVHSKFMNIYRLMKDLRKNKFDMVISGQEGSLRIPLVAYLCGANIRIGSKNSRLEFLYSKVVDFKRYSHSRLRKLSFIASLMGISLDNAHTFSSGIKLNFKGHHVAPFIKNLFKYKGLKITLASGADQNRRGNWSPSLKRWPEFHYAKLIKYLQSKYVDPNIFFVGDKREYYLANKVAELADVDLFNLCGKTALADLIYILQNSDVLICNDTGAMHLADFIGTPLISLFGPTDPKMFGPVGKGSLVIEGRGFCKKCFPRPTCGNATCCVMESITPDEVLNAVDSLLKRIT